MAWRGDVTASVLVFGLGARKTLIESRREVVGPQSSDFTATELGNSALFEVQVKLDGPARNNTLLGVLGQGFTGALNPVHRLVHTELAKIPCELFGPRP